MKGSGLMTGHVSWKDVRDQRGSSLARRKVAKSALENQVAGYQLSELRKARGLTQQQVADVMGVSQRRVSAVERGDVDRSEISTLRAYVEALGGQIRIVAEFSEESALIA